MILARRARTRATALTAVLVALAALAGCGRRAPAPEAPPTPPVTGPPLPTRPRPGYDARRDSLDSVDASVLRGRRIVLDPGHGGLFRGALGPGGTTEAEVNLGVSLALRDLLERAGAQVQLTRTTDRDFLTPADSALRADLAERVRIANAFAPDLFVSIHHNADAGARNDINEIQTYAKLGDDGPSLEAAADIHRALVRNVGIEIHKVLPGNYYVLRNTDAPALLTETSYITNPDVEERLRLPEKQRLEAEAIYLGIARYFARRVPVVARFEARPSADGRPDTLFTGDAPVLVAEIAGAFDVATLRLDDQALPVTIADGRVTARPAPLAQGRHEARLTVRLGGQGSARERRLAFTVRRPAVLLRARALPDSAPREGGLVAVRVDARDAWGQAVAAPVRLRVAAACPCDSVLEGRVTTRDGLAWALVQAAPRERRPQAHRYNVGLTVRAPDIATPRATAGAGGGPLATRLSIPVARTMPGPAVTRLRATPGDTALTDAPGTAGPEPTRMDLTREGFLVAARDSSGRPVAPAIAGWRPVPLGADSSATALPRRWTQWVGGALRGRRITIDPEGGGQDAAGVGPGGSRASHLNLEVARMLAAMLRAAGAEVQMTREGDVPLTDVQRVQVSEAFASDRFLRIGHRAARLGYYYASPAGRRWAQGTARAAERLRLSPLVWGEDAQVALQQTACPALYASLASVADSAGEVRLLAPGALRAGAYALFLGLAQEWSDAAWPIDSLAVRDAAGAPAAGAIVTFGGALVLETDAAGMVRFSRTEPAPMLVTVDHPRVRARMVLSETARGVVLTGAPSHP
jgi:N-acetylmuramoyl-L-alanine amidase